MFGLVIGEVTISQHRLIGATFQNPYVFYGFIKESYPISLIRLELYTIFSISYEDRDWFSRFLVCNPNCFAKIGRYDLPKRRFLSATLECQYDFFGFLLGAYLISLI